MQDFDFAQIQPNLPKSNQFCPKGFWCDCISCSYSTDTASSVFRKRPDCTSGKTFASGKGGMRFISRVD